MLLYFLTRWLIAVYLDRQGLNLYLQGKGLWGPNEEVESNHWQRLCYLFLFHSNMDSS